MLTLYDIGAVAVPAGLLLVDVAAVASAVFVVVAGAVDPAVCIAS
ncbi:hypothetical protein [Paraburkholderia sp. GAS334]